MNVDIEKCVDHILDIVKEGGFSALIEQFKSHPATIGYDIIAVLLFLYGKIFPHVHEPTFGSASDDKLLELAAALGITASESSDKSFVWEALFSILIRVISDWINTR